MALVRRTEKLQLLIKQRMENIRTEKIIDLIENLKVLPLVEKLLDTANNENLIIPVEDKEWFKSHSMDALNRYVGFSLVHLEFKILLPEVPNDRYHANGYKLFAIRSTTSKSIFPAFKAPPFVVHNESEQICATYSCIDALPKLTVTMKIPLLAQGEIQPDHTYLFTTVDKPAKYFATGIYEHALTEEQSKLATPKRSGHSFNDVPSSIDTIFEEFDEIRNVILRTVGRFYKTESYIFGELWKLPSLNKMIEFCPSIKAFLPLDTLAQVLKGGRAKKEYNIMLPDQDILVSATEASILK